MVSAVKLLFSATAVLAVSIAACGGDDDSSDTTMSPDGGGRGAEGGAPVCPDPPPAPQKPAASCDVSIVVSPVSPTIRHVPEGTALEYCTNPPSGGDHYPIWAAFQEYDKPIDWPYLVHSMEHGAVVLLYKCDPACPEIVDVLRKVRDEAAPDPLCAGQATPKRIIIAPSPTIPTKVAAAAWGAAYTANCADHPTLAAFVRDHYAKGPENFCSPGRVF
jgi:hypothetical protein